MSSSIANNIIKTFSESAEERYDRLHSVDLKTASKELLLENAKKRIAFEQSGLERLKYLFDQATGGAFTDSNLAVVKFINPLFLTKELLQMREKFNQLENQATVKITDEKFKEDFLEFTNSADIYRKQRKEINEMISMGITTVLAVGVSLASSGAATPVILALYTSGASVGTEILVKSIISGEDLILLKQLRHYPLP